MAMTIGMVPRAGTIHFNDAGLSIWEEGLGAARSAGGHQCAEAWERQFKREVFTRIIQTLNRLGWTCVVPPEDIAEYSLAFARNRRYCRKGELQADLSITGRTIRFDMFQEVNAPDRPDNGGRYQSDKEGHMPYTMRLEMERTRRRIRTYLLNVFTEYAFKPSRPTLGVMGVTGMEFSAYRRRTTGHYVPALDRAQFTSTHEALSADGHSLENGMRVYAIDNGRVISGTAYFILGGNWHVVTGRYAVSQVWHTQIWKQCPGNPRVKRNSKQRRQRLEAELAKAIAAMRFERAAVLRDILFPNNPVLFAIWNTEHQVYHRTHKCGYTRDLSEAGKFTLEEVRGWDQAPNKVIPLAVEGVAA